MARRVTRHQRGPSIGPELQRGEASCGVEGLRRCRRRRGGEKSLRRACPLEPDPTSFSASDQLMRILRAIVRSTTGDVAIGYT